ncbi:hypothetical protein EUX98_g5032 [Antrodiella citrinella]|uniref:Uncharacterized protein n=1 Tax=Antrodiella citrinella TaxID=2447956 RepID=A0A4S4MUD2_9APHY|nr:hypothetical protein EUX98_g5032 [Antrodiella citrinella]
MILCSSSHSHTPGSIFPDIPSRHSFIAPPDGRPDFMRRHTTAHVPPTSPRRESRPLRSSPLAGPSLALDSDGLLKPGSGSEESCSSESGESRYRPSRISSTPNIPSMLTVFEAAAQFPTDGLPSSGSDSIGSPVSILLSPPPESPVPVLLPATPEPSKQSRRISWGIARITSLPSVPSKPASILSRSSSKGSVTSTGSHKVSVSPPVPNIPIWALPSHTESHRAPSSATSSSTRTRPKSTLAPNGYTHVLRPSTAPELGMTSKASKRRSALAGPPSTSRDPELNWLTQAAPPRFSRMSLKAEGVVMPVSAKDTKLANRRSTASTLSPVSPTYGSPSRERQREAMPSRTPSRSSLISTTSALSQDSILRSPPYPRFASSSRSGSYSSIESTLSLSPSTPELTVSRSPSLISEDGVDEFGMSAGYLEQQASKGETVSVQANAADAAQLETSALTREKAEAAVESTATVTTPEEPAPGGAKVQRGKGTLKRVWRRVVRSVKG